MLPSSAKEPIRIVADWRKDDAAPPVYVLRPATVRTRAHFNAQLVREGVRQPSREEMLACLREGIGKVVAEDQREEFLQLVDDANQALSDIASSKEVSEEERARQMELLDQLRQLEQQVALGWPRLAQLQADSTLYHHLAPVIAFQCMVTGVEGIPVSLKFNANILSEDCLQEIEAAGYGNDIVAVGVRAIAAMYLPKALEKN